MVRVTVSGEDNQSVGNRAVFLDRDGVLNRSIVKNGKPYAPRTFKDFEVYGHAEESLALIRKMGFKILRTRLRSSLSKTQHQCFYLICG